jgi:hypothetical protein
MTYKTLPGKQPLNVNVPSSALLFTYNLQHFQARWLLTSHHSTNLTEIEGIIYSFYDSLIEECHYPHEHFSIWQLHAMNVVLTSPARGCKNAFIDVKSQTVFEITVLI